MIDVLIVDDSPVVRGYLQYLLEEDSEIRVAGTAKNGREAVEFGQRQRPDVIVMDVHMPVMDGFEATRKIMETCPVPIVIVSASWDPEEMEKTFRALEAGAVAALEKPRGIGHPDDGRSVREFVQTVKLMAEVKVVKRWPEKRVRKMVPGTRPEAKRRESAAVDVVAIGASTGGPAALQKVLSGIPGDFPVPLLVVQHIAPGFLQGLAAWLGQACGLPVHIATQGERLQLGHVYLAPDGFHLGVSEGGRIALSRSEPEHNLRPAVSYLFRSVVDVFGEKAVGVLLTGMGKDGGEELKRMRERGAVTLAQDRESSVVHGMPGEAIKLGAVDYVLSPDEIAAKLESLVNHR